MAKDLQEKHDGLLDLGVKKINAVAIDDDLVGDSNYALQTDDTTAIGDEGWGGVTENDFEYAIASTLNDDASAIEMDIKAVDGINGHIDGGTVFMTDSDIGLDCIRVDDGRHRWLN